MGETETLSVERALRTIQKLEGMEVGLYQRTEGITAILWGFITAGIFFTFSTFGAVFGEEFPMWATFMWVPWVAAGYVTTWALWRSAAITAKAPFKRSEGLKELVYYFVVYMVLFGLGFTLYYTAGGEFTLKEPGLVTLILGVASTAASLLRRGKSSRPARMVALVVGVLAIAASLILAFAVSYSDPWEPYWYQTLGGVLTLGVGWIVGGVYLTIKG